MADIVDPHLLTAAKTPERARGLAIARSGTESRLVESSLRNRLAVGLQPSQMDGDGLRGVLTTRVQGVSPRKATRQRGDEDGMATLPVGLGIRERGIDTSPWKSNGTVQGESADT
jgi:hypothetical protein